MRYSYLLPILLPFLIACQTENKEGTSDVPRPVRTIQVKNLGTIDKSYTGVVEAEEFSVLAFKVAGPLTKLNVQVGQKIPKGYVIAQVAPQDYRLKYESAQANYNTAKAIYERNKRLLAQNATAVQNVEIAQADYIQAGAALNITKSTLGYASLTAPFSGLIENKYVENFQEISVGEPIVRLVNPDKINIRFILPETSIGLVNIPKSIYVEFDTYRGKKFRTDIKEYIYSSDGSGIPVTLRINDPDFNAYRHNVYPGFSCRVYFELENTISNKFIIPLSALFSENDKEYLWVVNPKNQTVERREVTTLKFDNSALVKEGINSDDIIVTAGVTLLKEGQHIRIGK